MDAKVAHHVGTSFSIFDCTNGFSVCMRLLSVVPRAAYTATPAGEPNSFVYLDYSNQAAGFGSYVNPLTETSDFGPFPSNMETRFNHANLYIVEYAADTSNPVISAFRGYVPDFTGSVPGDGQRRIQLGAKLEL